MNPAISNADNAIENFMSVTLGETLQMRPSQGPIWSSTARLTAASSAGLIQIKGRELPHKVYFGQPDFS